MLVGRRGDRAERRRRAPRPGRADGARHMKSKGEETELWMGRSWPRGLRVWSGGV